MESLEYFNNSSKINRCLAIWDFIMEIKVRIVVLHQTMALITLAFDRAVDPEAVVSNVRLNKRIAYKNKGS